MRWPRLWRRRGGVLASPHGTQAFSPGSWGTPVSPAAPLERLVSTAGHVEVISSTPELGVTSSEPAVAPPEPAAVAPAAVVPTEHHPPTPVPVVSADSATIGVRLGFSDGTDLQLDPQDPHSLALKAVAELLLHTGPQQRRVS